MGMPEDGRAAERLASGAAYYTQSRVNMTGRAIYVSFSIFSLNHADDVGKTRYPPLTYLPLVQ